MKEALERDPALNWNAVSATLHYRNDADLALLNDADALSFFSLNSWGFVAYHGDEHTRKKVTYTLERMSPGAVRHLTGLRLPPLVRGLIL